MTRARATISACVIAANEEQRLPACLASLDFCDEIVVVDGCSEDATAEIATAAGAQVIRQPWLGFAAQRNIALENARSDWVLEVDADERISGELAREIERFLDNPPPGTDIAGLPIRHRYLGRCLGPSAKYPDYRHRLFRRGVYRHDPSRIVHEGLWPRGPVAAFAGELQHELAASLREAVRDAWSYARGESVQLDPASGTSAYLTGMLVRPPIKFLYRLTVGGGWRDGWRGVLYLALAAGSDALVWGLAVSHRRRGRGPSSTGHFSAAGTADRGGPAHVVAVAHGSARTERTARWLAEAASNGLDVVLIADTRPIASSTRTRLLPSLGPFKLARVIDAEHSLRPIDALIAAGSNERIRLSLVPRALHGVGVLGLDVDPVALAAAVERYRDSGGDTAARPGGRAPTST